MITLETAGPRKARWKENGDGQVGAFQRDYRFNYRCVNCDGRKKNLIMRTITMEIGVLRIINRPSVKPSKLGGDGGNFPPVEI